MAWLKNVFNRGGDEIAETDADMGLQETSEEEGQLAVDVFQDKDNVYVKSTIAGVKPEDLDITLSGSEVTINGERKEEEEVKEKDYIYQECYWGAFSRSFTLPVEIDVDKAEADIKEGILTLTLPKASRSRTKKVKVRGEE
ncbi:MAG: Hsp20/alpha crystallin family protein [Candidatus Doudnabacteria bacterium]|nr:Hsp20/alpha crystallin family protein [Candidatus Doudnabacteria bacterium]